MFSGVGGGGESGTLNCSTKSDEEDMSTVLWRPSLMRSRCHLGGDMSCLFFFSLLGDQEACCCCNDAAGCCCNDDDDDDGCGSAGAAADAARFFKFVVSVFASAAAFAAVAVFS